MSSVVARVFAASPTRSADATWSAIVDLLTRGRSGSERDELLAVTGTASSLIADKTPEGAPIVVTCDGPRTRIRCVYDEDALDGTGVNEGVLGHDPLTGNWSVSLPCPAAELAWVKASLARHSSRVVARDADEAVAAQDPPVATGAFEIDVEGFLK